MRAIILIGLICLQFTINALTLNPVNGSTLKSILPGHFILLNHLTNSFKKSMHSWMRQSAAIAFYENGTMSLVYIYSSNGLHYPAKSDTGTWEIKDNKLCLHWQVWEHGELHCVTFHATKDLYVILDKHNFLVALIKKKNII